MSFLAPLFLLGTLAIAGPILLHLIRRTTREQTPFSSLMFLRQTPPRVTRRSRLLLGNCFHARRTGDGENGERRRGVRGSGSYTHGIATYALAEYYAMTKDENAAEVVKKAVKRIVDGQGPDGGWMYSFDKSQSDTSVGGWQIQALKAAYLAGLDNEGVGATLEKAMGNLKRVQGPNGGFGYRGAEDRYSLTGVGILCTYLREGKSKSVTEGMKFLSSQIEKHPLEYQHATADLYAWYYNTQACFMYGEPVWSKWNLMFQDPLIKAQASDGSWPPMTYPAHGALQNAEGGAGPFYRTTLCILMLEVYYRYARVPN